MIRGNGVFREAGRRDRGAANMVLTQLSEAPPPPSLGSPDSQQYVPKQGVDTGARPVDEWEYLSILAADPNSDAASKPFSLEDQLSEHGRKGWELVAVVPTCHTAGLGGIPLKQRTWADFYRLIFKRRIGEAQLPAVSTPGAIPDVVMQRPSWLDELKEVIAEAPVRTATSSGTQVERKSGQLIVAGKVLPPLDNKHAVVAVYCPAKWDGEQIRIFVHPSSTNVTCRGRKVGDEIVYCAVSGPIRVGILPYCTVMYGLSKDERVGLYPGQITEIDWRHHE